MKWTDTLPLTTILQTDVEGVEGVAAALGDRLGNQIGAEIIEAVLKHIAKPAFGAVEAT